jgi:hypothetical protein
MTSRDEANQDAVPADFGVIAELVDGESVNTSRLKDALNSREVREYFVDVLALRASLRTMAWPELSGRRERRGVFVPAVRWIAAGLVLGSLGGYFLGQHQAGLPVAHEVAPSPLVIDVSQPPSAPAPTHIIRLEPGRNWETKTGGH